MKKEFKIQVRENIYGGAQKFKKNQKEDEEIMKIEILNMDQNLWKSRVGKTDGGAQKRGGQSPFPSSRPTYCAV